MLVGTRPAAEADARILIVDDNRLSARKLAMAMRALGHGAEICSGGAEALRRLAEEPFDLVLLDIVMPEVDGYDVLRAMRADPALREIPVVVISSLDDEVDSVVRALELGAEDFLPKNFEPAILRARIGSSLARKRFRDRELDYLADVQRLTGAARVIEAGAFRPSDLDIDRVTARPDALGQLATVFHGLAQHIYERERRLTQTVRTLRAILLVIAVGATFGLTPALSRMAVGLGAPSLGLLVWVNVVGAVTCFIVAAARGASFRIGRSELLFLIAWAVILGVLHRLTIFVVAGHVEASVIALVGSLRGFIVLAVAAMMAIEPPTGRRMAGMAVGFFAILLLLLQDGGPGHVDVWVAAALLVPLLHAAHTLLITRRPRELDTYVTVGAMMALSAVLVAPFAIATDGLVPPQVAFGRLELIVVALGISSAISLALVLDLVRLAGAVFTSLVAYSQTVAGVLWAMLLLGESLSPVAWISLGAVLAALWLVEPRRVGDEFTIRLSFRRRIPRPDG